MRSIATATSVAAILLSCAAAPGVAAEQQATARSVSLQSRYAAGGWHVPDEVDRENARERFLLLLPGGPLIVEAEVTIDGKPYRMHREKMIDDLLAELDTDDAEPPWKKIVDSTTFWRGRYAGYAANEAARTRFVQQFDKNRDGLIQRSEIRWLVAQMYGGPALTVMPGSFGAAGANQADVKKLLDTDGDGAISPDELTAAPLRLKSRDADDDDLLELSELAGTPYAGYRYAVGRQGGRSPGILLLLGDDVKWSELYQTLLSRYGKEGSLAVEHFSLVPALAAHLDGNGDGVIDGPEALRLADVEAHLRLSINLGNRTEDAQLLVLDGADEQLQKQAEPRIVDDRLQIELPQLRLEVAVADITPTYNYGPTVQSLFNQWDKDKNGYLEQGEIPENQRASYVQFEAWDADGDGKAFPEEVEQAYVRAAEPSWNRISAAASPQSSPWFAALDVNGDRRLSIREMQRAAGRLKTFDKNNDGAISGDEVPETIRFALGRGAYAYQALGNIPFRSNGGGANFPSGNRASQPAANGPAWFTRLDRNADGDLSRREFPGTDEQFQRLDQDGDGFIVGEEAGNVGDSTR